MHLASCRHIPHPLSMNTPAGLHTLCTYSICLLSNSTICPCKPSPLHLLQCAPLHSRSHALTIACAVHSPLPAHLHALCARACPQVALQAWCAGLRGMRSACAVLLLTHTCNMAHSSAGQLPQCVSNPCGPTLRGGKRIWQLVACNIGW
jgi:hypothetical protein